MKTKSKIWLGVGAFVVGAGTMQAPPGNAAEPALSRLATETAIPRSPAGGFVIAQHGHGGEAGEAGEEGGAKGAGAKLPPELAFALRLGQLRGHLLVGDELVKQKQWLAALPHFLHPTEEIYNDLRAQLKEYGVPPFEAALKLLASVVKAKKGGDDYAKAWQSVADALVAADAGLAKKQAAEPAFVVETALELAKSASGEYEEAIVKGRIAKPVEYQDARGFIFQSERMMESVAPALEKKDAEALTKLRAAYADLKKAFPAAMPPKTPVMDQAALLSAIARIELAAGKFM